MGLGYLTEFQKLSSTFDLGSGEVTDTNRERRGYFLPTINYEFGQEPNSKMGWYSKFSYGRKISVKKENSAAFIIELGLRFNLNKK